MVNSVDTDEKAHIDVNFILKYCKTIFLASDLFSRDRKNREFK